MISIARTVHTIRLRLRSEPLYKRVRPLNEVYLQSYIDFPDLIQRRIQSQKTINDRNAVCVVAIEADVPPSRNRLL